MNREGQLRNEEIESELQENDLATVHAIEKHKQKDLDKLGKELDELLMDKSLIDEANTLTKKLHGKNKNDKIIN